MKQALCSYVSASHLPGWRALVKSLAAHNDISKLDLIVFSNDLDTAPGATVHRVPWKQYQDIPIKNSRYRTCHFKLEAFRLTEYDSVILIDCDMLCRSRFRAIGIDMGPDTLWAAPDLGIGEAGTFDGHHTRINTGLLVIGKNYLGEETHEQMMTIARAGRSYDGGDQGTINTWIMDHQVNLCYLPQECNLLKRVYVYHPNRWRDLWEKCVFLHFVGIKPWQGSDTRYASLEEYWHAYA